MTSLVTKVGKKYATSHARQFEPEDPFYEFYDAGNGKQKRRKRAPPPGLTKQEAKLLKKIARRAHYLDKGFYVCGMRFGWTAMIGIIPGAGDVANALLNYTLVYRPSKKGADLPSDVCRQMLFNNAFSAGVGLVPIAGDIALAVWKANSRNCKILEAYLRAKGQEHIAAGMTGLTPDTTKPNHHQSTSQVPAASANQSVETSTVPASGTSTPQTRVAEPSTTNKKKFWGSKSNK